MRNIVVVEACSTGYNYVEDILKRGYEPVVLEVRFTGNPETVEFMNNYRKRCYAKFPRRVKIIQEKENYEETLEMVRALDPVLIVTGEEGGVELSTHLSDDLGLLGNSYADIDKFIRKSSMHSALIDHGVRGIRGKLVTSVEDAVGYCEELGTWNVVVKPTRGCGSQALTMCDCRETVENAVKEIIGATNYFGEDIHEALIQERIFGTEYIVNTMSRNGKHKVTDIWRYTKAQTKEGGYIYEGVEVIKELEIGHFDLIRYAYDTLDAIGIKDGPVHGEYMIDHKGPVLIEINCRPMGLAMPAGYLNQIMGHHLTDFILDSLLDENYFEQERRKPYHIINKGYVKMFIVPKEIQVVAEPILPMIERMKSVNAVNIKEAVGITTFAKTNDMESNGGVLYMVHEDEHVLNREIELLRRIEKDYFRMILHGTGKKETPVEKLNITLDDVMRITECRGCTLVVTSGKIHSQATVVDREHVENAFGEYDNVIFDSEEYGEGKAVEELIRSIFCAIDKVKTGGRFIVSREFYQKVPYGSIGMEILMLLYGLQIQAPACDVKDVITGVKIK